MRRGAAMVLIMTGNVGKFGTGQHTWAGNYKAGTWTATPWSGAGLAVHTGEDPFNITLDPNAHGKEIKTKSYYYGEEVGYLEPWRHRLDRQHAEVWPQGVYGQDPHADAQQIPLGDQRERAQQRQAPLRHGANVDPNIEMLITQDIEMTSDVNHDDIAFACNSWMEFTYPEMTVTVSNPWVQIWKGGIRPLYDTRNDLDTFAGVAAKLTRDDRRQADAGLLPVRLSEPRGRLCAAHAGCLQHLLRLQRRTYAEVGKGLDGHGAAPIRGIRSGKRRTSASPVDAVGPVSRPTGSSRRRSNTARTSSSTAKARRPRRTCRTRSSPRIRTSGRMTTGFRSRRSTMTTSTCATSSCRGGKSSGTATRCGRRATSSTVSRPKTRHRVHSQWSVNDWVQIYESNFGDPYRMDKRTPGVGEHQLHINPQAAKDRGINDGDYVYVDGNPVDRPYRGWKPSGSVLQSRAVDDSGEVQPGVSVPRHDGETRPVRGDGEVGQRPRDAAGRTRDCGGYRVSVQLPVRGAAVLYAEAG